MSSGNNPAIAMAWEGSRQLQDGELDTAVATLTEAIRLDPNRVHAYQVRAEAYRRLGRDAEAASDAALAAKLQREQRAVTNSTRARFLVKTDMNDNYFDFEGAIGRGKFLEHWVMSLVVGVGGIVLLTVLAAFGTAMAFLGLIIFLITSVISIWVNLAGVMKRLRDLGQPAQLVVLGFIPLVNIILWLYLVFAEGEE
jgi:uncharacterized membrane protein YhaH (DUF805 family)